MKDSQEYILFRSIELRYSSWIGEFDDLNQLQEGTNRSFNIIFNNKLDRIFFLIHFKHLSIYGMDLYYRKRSVSNKKKTNPQSKMKLSFNNTLELLTYLSSKNYKIDYFEIRFTNGWAIQQHLLNGLEFITNNKTERNSLLEKLIAISGQGPIDIDSLEINQTYTLCTNGTVMHKPIF